MQSTWFHQSHRLSTDAQHLTERRGSEGRCDRGRESDIKQNERWSRKYREVWGKERETEGYMKIRVGKT